MSSNQEKSPTGEWEMPEEPLTSALGHFILGWSLLEGTLEVAIAKELGLGAVDGSIVTASLIFRSRAAILLSLLNRDPEKNRTAIGIVHGMQNITDRNDMLHSVIGNSRSEIWFNRRKTENRFTSKIVRYDAKRLVEMSIRCSTLAGQLQQALAISIEDYRSFFHDAHKAANSD
jgi:hypothetical protein